jgi:short-subunit dehydrogenase
MDVNCFGALRMSLAVLPFMKRQHEGSIVNVGTISTVAPSSRRSRLCRKQGGPRRP